MITKPCKYCNKVFQSKRTTAEYCSNSCRVNFNLAKKRNLDVPAEKIEVETNSNEDYIVETQRNDSQQLDRLMLDNSNLKTKIDDLDCDFQNFCFLIFASHSIFFKMVLAKSRMSF